MIFTKLSDTEVTENLLNDLGSLMSQLVNRKCLISRDSLLQVQQDSKSETILIYDGKKCIGVGMIYRQDTLLEKKGWIEEVVIAEEYRGQGLGKKLLGKLLDISKLENITVVHLTSNKKRIIANALYTSLGFINHDETNFYYLLNK